MSGLRIIWRCSSHVQSLPYGQGDCSSKWTHSISPNANRKLPWRHFSYYRPSKRTYKTMVFCQMLRLFRIWRWKVRFFFLYYNILKNDFKKVLILQLNKNLKSKSGGDFSREMTNILISVGGENSTNMSFSVAFFNQFQVRLLQNIERPKRLHKVPCMLQNTIRGWGWHEDRLSKEICLLQRGCEIPRLQIEISLLQCRQGWSRMCGKV